MNNQNERAQSWLISSPIDLTNETEAYISFEYIIRYAASGKIAANHQLLISDNYNGNPANTTWTDLPYDAVEGSDWSTFYKANVTVPEQFVGKGNVVIALKYTATEKAGTWEVKNLVVSNTATNEEEEEEAPTDVLTVAQAIEAYTGTAKPAIVKGYIVGTSEAGQTSLTPIFGTDKASNTNILLADAADETDISKCIPVQLPSGDVRKKVNLQENPGNYKKQVTLTGSIEKYFGVTGLKSVTKALFEGEEDSEGDDEQPTGKVYLNETFASNLGSFTTAQIVNDYAWKHEVYQSKAYAKVSGYANGASQDAESWLISPVIDLTGETAAQVTFDYVINKGDATLAATNHQLMITDNYTGDFYTTEWTAVDFGATNDNSWNFRSAKANLPANFNGKNAVVIAFKYTSTTSASSTWEVCNVVVSGNAAAGDDNTGDDNTGDDNTGDDNTGAVAPAGSIAEILASPAGEATASGTVIATYARGFLVNDGTGSILVYLGNDNYKTGDVVTVTGTTSEYGGIMQFGNSATVEKTGTATVSLPSPVEMSGAALDAYIKSPETKYVQYTGTLSIDGYYYNVAVEGASTATGSISYPADGLVDANLNGKKVIVTGFAIGVSGTKYVNTMATSVVAAGGDDTTGGEEEDTPAVTESMTVAEYIAAFNSGTTGSVAVTGYIVGTSEAGKASYTPIFGIENASNTNLLLADDPNETDGTKCIPVQLPSGTIRATLNLQNNPANLGKKVTLTGDMLKYFGMAGLKNTSEYIFADTDNENTEDDEENTPSGAMTVAQLVSAFNAGTTGETDVIGYIVGTSEAGKASYTPIFGIENASNTNLLLADNPNETDGTKCIPVQLPSGTIRAALNLQDNPGNLGKKVTLTGNILKYFGMAGLKNTSDYIFE